jgi:tRNA(fMet)-specific endonuclease VapC
LVIVDTSILVSIERGKITLGQFACAVEQLQTSPALAAISLSELLAGVHRASNDVIRARREAQTESFLKRLPVLPFTEKVARVHARLDYFLEVRGLPVGAHDLIIAATALAHGASILTNDLRSFPRIPELPIHTVPLANANS